MTRARVGERVQCGSRYLNRVGNHRQGWRGTIIGVDSSIATVEWDHGQRTRLHIGDLRRIFRGQPNDLPF